MTAIAGIPDMPGTTRQAIESELKIRIAGVNTQPRRLHSEKYLHSFLRRTLLKRVFEQAESGYDAHL